MRVTCELWAYIEQYGGKLMSNRQAEELAAIAEHIDQAHESVISDMRREHDEWVADRDANYVKLPVDADDVPICVGDELDYLEALHPDVPARFKVQNMFYCGNGKWHLRAFPATYDPRKCRHHHRPTVEDVLREFAEKIIDSQIPNVHPTYEEAIAEYAAKLRLAEAMNREW